MVNRRAKRATWTLPRLTVTAARTHFRDENHNQNVRSKGDPSTRRVVTDDRKSYPDNLPDNIDNIASRISPRAKATRGTRDRAGRTQPKSEARPSRGLRGRGSRAGPTVVSRGEILTFPDTLTTQELSLDGL